MLMLKSTHNKIMAISSEMARRLHNQSVSNDKLLLASICHKVALHFINCVEPYIDKEQSRYLILHETEKLANVFMSMQYFSQEEWKKVMAQHEEKSE